MKSIIYRMLKKRQFLVMLGFSFALGLSSLITGDVIKNFPQESFFGYPASVYSFQLLVIPIPTLIIFRFLFPLISSIAVGDNIAQDISTGYIKSFVSHSSLKKYLVNNIVISFILGGLVSIIPVLVSMWGMFLFIPHIPLNRFYSMMLVSSQEFMPNLYFEHPLFYFFIRVGFIFIFGGAISVLATIVSFYLKNRYLSVVVPMFVLMFIDMTIRVFQREKLTLSSQFIGTEKFQWTGVVFLVAILIFAGLTVVQGVRKHEI